MAKILTYPERVSIVFYLDSNPRLYWIFRTLLCGWSRKLAQLSEPVRHKTKTNHDLVALVFPRFRQFLCFYFEFSLALKDIFLF